MTEAMHLWRQRIFRRLLVLLPSQKRLVMVMADLVCIPAALWTAMTLKEGTPLHTSPGDSWLYVAAILSSVPVFARLGLYRAIVRFLGTRALLAVIAGVSVSVALLLIVNQLLLGKGVHISTFAIYWALALIYVGGSRFLARGLIQVRRLGSDRVAIYGAGSRAPRWPVPLGSGRYYAVAFVDDSKGLHGSSINGIEVFGPEDLPSLIADDGVNTVLLALPSLSRRRRQEILRSLEPLAVHVQTVPDIADIVTGRATVGDIREVDTHDLLGRDPVTPQEELFRDLRTRQGRHGDWRRRFDRLRALQADRATRSVAPRA